MTFDGDIRGELGSITTGLSFVITFLCWKTAVLGFLPVFCPIYHDKGVCVFLQRGFECVRELCTKSRFRSFTIREINDNHLGTAVQYLVLRLMAAAASEASAAISLDCAKLWKADPKRINVNKRQEERGG